MNYQTISSLARIRSETILREAAARRALRTRPTLRATPFARFLRALGIGRWKPRELVTESR